MKLRKFWLCALLCMASVILGLSVAGQEVQEINVLHIQIPIGVEYTKPLESEFEEKTGIKVNVDYLPEAQLLPKVRTVLGSKDDAYDVIFYRGNLLPELISAGALEPLNAYIERDASEVELDDFNGPSLSVFNYDDTIYGFPAQSGGIVLFYNKEIFEQAGLTKPPRTVEELEEVSKIIKEKTGKAAFAMPAMRDSGIIVYPWIFFWKLESPKWYDNIKGSWFDENWMPQLHTKEAISSVERWARILNEYGPKGIASYGYNECVLDFQQGELAMWFHQTHWAPQFEDPSKSKVVGKVGYAVLEGRPGDTRYGTDSPWGLVMNAHSKKKEAAWEFIKYFHSKETCMTQVRMGYNQPYRTSAIESQEFVDLVGAEMAAAIKKAASVSDPTYKPIIPQQGEINEIMAIQLSKALSGQATAEEAMLEADEKILAVMKRDGYIK